MRDFEEGLLLLRAMAYDPEIHEEPFAFRPERWLPQEGGGEAKGPEPLPHDYSFGFGRRYVGVYKPVFAANSNSTQSVRRTEMGTTPGE